MGFSAVTNSEAGWLSLPNMQYSAGLGLGLGLVCSSYVLAIVSENGEVF